MYVWRKQNRRDRRNLLTSGVEYWGPPVGSQNTDARDEEIRKENEALFVDALVLTLRKAIHNYLGTRHGHMEINHVIHEIELLEAPLVLDNPDVVAVPLSAKHNDKQRKNVKEIFRKYDADGSYSIDKDELKCLLKDLQLPITSESELDALFKDLDPDGEGAITFDNFYGWFDREANNTRKKNWWHFFKSASANAGGRFKRMIHEVEARNSIVDKVVDDTRRHAYEEFRRAHPPRFPCTFSNCFECFPNASKMQRHLQDSKFHERIDYELSEMAHKFAAVENAFKGKQGRRLHANRLLFSVDLADLKPRLHNLTEQPYRPHLSDIGAVREKQLRQGMLVLGADPKSGIRPVAMSRNLRRQHRANCTLPPVPTNIDSIHHSLGDFNKPNLGATLLELMQCRDEKIDTVVADEIGGRKDIVFEWKGYVHSDTEILGEFNGWKREKLFPDAETGRLFIIKSLCAGRYRYRYIVNGEEAVDPFATQITDGDVVSNVILVVNPPIPRPPKPTFGPDKRRGEDGNELEPEPELEKSVPAVAGINGDRLYANRHIIDLRNTRLCDDGAWALTVSVQPNSIIHHLDLSFNDISDDGISAVAIAVSRLKAIEVLKLNGNGFSSDGANHLVKVLKDSTTIRVLEMCSNRIGDDGAEFISDLLIKFHPSLEELYLDSNYIGNDGAACIGEAIVRNRSIRILSLAENRIYPFGADRLCIHLRRNGYLRSLRLNSNPLGPLGIKSVGDMLGFNDSIRHIDISSSNMLRNNDVQGFYALNFALKRNKGLQHLVIKNCGLTSENVMELGYALFKNKGLKKLDMDSNYIPDKWWKPNCFIDTKLMMQMPSIQTSLDLHIATAADPQLGHRYVVHDRPMEDGFVGIWTNRRVWTAKDREGEFLKAKKKKQLASEEASRMEAEDIFVAQEFMKEMDKFKLYINDSKAGKKLVKTVVKVIDLYIASLDKLVPTENLEAKAAAEAAALNASLKSPSKRILSRRARVISMSARSIPDSSKTAATSTKTTTTVADTSQDIKEQEEKVADDISYEDEAIEWLKNSHQGVLAAVFEVCGADQKRLHIPFSSIGAVLETLCVPVTAELVAALETRSEKKQKRGGADDKRKGSIKRNLLIRQRSNYRNLQNITDDGRSISSEEKVDVAMATPIGFEINSDSRSSTSDITASRPNDCVVDFFKFVKAFAEFVPDTVRNHHYAHLKAVAFNVLNSKKKDIAVNLLIRANEFAVVKSLKYKYRKTPDKAPHFLCEECNERFSSQSNLDKHKAKSRIHHFKYYRELGLWRSREAIIREAKFYITGQRFPMYYRLRDALSLPRDFHPQVYDTHGADARPIGIIEPEYLVRVNDSVGDWLKINFDGGHGWMLSKAGSMTVMFPAHAGGDFWKQLKPFHEPVYYHVRFELPEETEIKVRYSPDLKAGVCGAIKRGMVVSAGAILDETWLEIRYDMVDAAWVLLESSAGIQFMRKVDDSLQMPFANTLKSSPVLMTMEDLEPIAKPDLLEDGDEEPDSRPNTATSVATSAQFSDFGDASDVIA